MDNVDILNPIAPWADCSECGDPLPDVRVRMGAYLCAYCQGERETLDKQREVR